MAEADSCSLLRSAGAEAWHATPRVGAVSLSSRLLQTDPEAVLDYGLLNCLFISSHSEFESLPVPSRNKFVEWRELDTVTVLCRKHKVLGCGVCPNHWNKVPARFVAVLAA